MNHPAILSEKSKMQSNVYCATSCIKNTGYTDIYILIYISVYACICIDSQCIYEISYIWGRNWVVEKQGWEEQLFFALFQFITFRFCTVQEVWRNAKTKNCRFFSLAQNLQSQTLWGKVRGSAILTRAVCDSCAHRSWRAPDSILVMHSYQNYNSNNDVSSNEHLFKKIKIQVATAKIMPEFYWKKNPLAQPSIERFYTTTKYSLFSLFSCNQCQ